MSIWKRPRDESAGNCFSGSASSPWAPIWAGYHWTEIVVEPALIYGFAAFAALRPDREPALLPGLPPPQADLRAAPAGGLDDALYAVPTGFVLPRSGGACTRAGRLRSRATASESEAEPWKSRSGWIKGLAMRLHRPLGGWSSASASSALVAELSGGDEPGRAEPDRTGSSWLLGWLSRVPDQLPALAATGGTRPASGSEERGVADVRGLPALLRSAYALSITRYKLMQVEEIYNRGKLVRPGKPAGRPVLLP